MQEPEHYCRDSMSGMGVVLQLLAERRQPLHSVVASLPRYVMIKQKAEFSLDRLSWTFWNGVFPMPESPN